jgi:hypothetical protein
MIGYHLGTHAADLLERGVEQLGPAQLFEHPPGRRHHSTGELMVVVGGVVFLRLADWQFLLASDLTEVRGDRLERVEVEPVGEPLGLQVAERRLRSRIRGAARQRLDRRVQHVEARAKTFHVHERCESDRAVTVELDRPRARRAPEVGRELADGIHGQETARILEVEAVHLRAVGQRGGALRVVGVRVDLAYRVGECDRDLLDTLLACDRGHASQAPGVVRRIGHLEAPNSVSDDAAERESHNVLASRNPGNEAHA